MGVLANSAIVGAATFLVGSVLMELKIKQEGTDVKWWPYVATFLSGGLGFYLVSQADIVEVKDAESKECPLCDESYDAVDDKWGDPLCECLCQFCFDAKPTDTVRGEWVCTTCKKEHDNEPEDWMAESDEAEAKCKYCELNDPENCMYFGPTCLDAESFAGEMDATEGYIDNDGVFQHIGNQGLVSQELYDLENGKYGEGDVWTCGGMIQKVGENLPYSGWMVCPHTFKVGDYYAIEEDIDEYFCATCSKDWKTCEECEQVYDPDGEHMESCHTCGGEGWIMTDYDSGDRWNPPSSDSRPCEECYGGEVCSLEAESFSAEGRKIRRRSRLAWTKGFDPAVTMETIDYYSSLMDYQKNNSKFAYHINDLPEGYYIHLYRPRSRRGKWKAWCKSPKDTEAKYFYATQKSHLTQQILDWYNTASVKPESQKELTPIQQMMLQHGMITDEPTIARVVIKGYDRKRTINGKQVVVKRVPTEYQWYAFGGPDKLPMHKFASLKGGKLEIFPKHEISGVYAFADNFLRGLVFLDAKKVGKESSVAKYNKDSKKWVSLYPAWFQNACEHDVKDLRFEEKYGDEYQINGHTFLEFNERGRTQGDGFEVKISFEQPHKVSKTIQNKMWKQAGDEWQKQNGPTTATQSMSIAHWSIFAQCVAKYQPQKNDLFTRSLNTWGPTEFAGSPWGRVMKVGQGKYMDSAAHIFLRRLGKKK